MSASVSTRFTWTDDDGTGTTGTIVNNAELQKIFDAIDAMFAGSGSYATLELGGKLKIDSTAGDALWSLGGHDFSGIAAPAVSGAGKARFYFDSTLKQMQLSEDGGAFKGLGAVAPYTPTLANSNGTTQTTVASVPVLANEMAIGDRLFWDIDFLIKNNKGSAGTLTFDWFWGATTGASVTGANIADNATERRYRFQFVLIREGSDLWVPSTELNFYGVDQVPFSGDLSTASNMGLIAAPTFTSTQTVALKLTCSATHGSFYANAQSARVWRQKAA